MCVGFENSSFNDEIFLSLCTVRTLEAVKPSTVAHFRHLAEKLVAEKDSIELLSAALAVVSGNADIKQRSLLSSRQVVLIVIVSAVHSESKI